MGINGKEKSKLILQLIFKHIVEEGKWSEFTTYLISEVKREMRVELGDDFYTIGVEKASDRLVEKLGEHSSVLLAYRAEEVILEMDEPSNNATVSDTESDKESGTEEFYDTPDTLKEDESEYNGPHNTVESVKDDNAEKEIDKKYATSDKNEEEEVNPTIQEVEHEEERDVPVHTCERDLESDQSDSNDIDDKENRYEIPSGAEIKSHLKRMAAMLSNALKDSTMSSEIITIEEISRQLEHFIFNPPISTPTEFKDVRHNFYPPFAIPKAICNYHIFTMTAPIPRSCKANRYGTDIHEKARTSNYFRRLPKWRVGVTIEDGLGNDVTPIGELKDEVKLVPLKEDIARLQWVKSKCDHVTYFGYPSLHLPPKISCMLMETLLHPFSQDGQNMEKSMPAISDDELAAIVDPEGKMSTKELYGAIDKKRAMMLMAVRIGCQLNLMERVFRDPSMIKKCHECLHHTFHHGYVSVVRDVAKVNLSNFITFHGVTHNNPLNNCIVTKLCEGIDREDLILDSIYLFLVLTWQTGMGMWNQAIDDNTVQIYREVFTKFKRQIYALPSVSAMSNIIVDLIMDGNRLVDELRKSLPNFISMTQISNFRNFIMERSNMPSIIVPMYPSDFIPLLFKQSTMALWDQVYLLQIAFFFMNHGGYLWEPTDETPNQKSYCPCNLCSPHRMPLDNHALHNEMLAIGTFEFQNEEGKSFKLTPELWTNAYLDKFIASDYNPFHVMWYRDHKDTFKSQLSACVTSSPEIFALVRQIHESREEFIRTKGRGVYKDPSTGEELTCSRPGSVEGPTISTPIAHKLGRIKEKNSTFKPIRDLSDRHDSEAPRYDERNDDCTEGGRRMGIHRKHGHVFRNRGYCRGRGSVYRVLRRPDRIPTPGPSDSTEIESEEKNSTADTSELTEEIKKDECRNEY